MYLADYHTHSSCSPDAGSTMTEMAEAGIAAGLHELCFTDHVETLLWGTNRLRESYDWTEMLRQFGDAQAVCGDRIRLKLGVELGEAPHDFAVADGLLAAAPPLDFIIGSVHTLSAAYGWENLFFSAERDETRCRERIADYLGEVYKLAQWGKFDVLGHLTLPLRYFNENLGLSLTFDGFEPQVTEIFHALIDNGCGIEVNTNRGNTPLPDEKWLRLYRALGGEIVTLGSDAHTPGFVGCALASGQRLLKDCGFTRFATFSKGQPLFHPL